MSREVIFALLHAEVLQLLERWGHRSLALQVERLGERHDIYGHLDRAFSMYYAEYGGVNCRKLREVLTNEREKVVKVVLPNLLRQYLAASRQDTPRENEAKILAN